MPQILGQNSASEKPLSITPTRLSRRTASELSSHSSVQILHTKEPPLFEPSKKRPRNSSSTPAAGQRKSVTVVLKAPDTEEFRTTNLPVASPTTDYSSKPPIMVAQPLPQEATPKDKVIAVIDFLRERRRRPDEKVVILYSERMYQVAPCDAKAALQSLVKEGRLFSVKYPSGISYRYHMSAVARGDTVTQQSNKIKAKYAATTTKSSGQNNPAKSSQSRSYSTPTSGLGIGDTFTRAEMNTLKSFLRLISPDNGVVRPSHVTSGDGNKIVDKIRSLLPRDELGDAMLSKPGLSVYVLPPPTPISLETIEKALKSLPHLVLVGAAV
uniref:H15 domain-containing protein n=1 Tax=Mesocestoides corti TaxID=53468 RepID=A0A5K3F6I1_MESCO